ncbi:hypothetical protein J1N35_035766 [Gossypium stocksii]|uniref:Uncharacterized protein n=1 Tax=Gossypium stocksii TaxID=47602 RepID=A0A9D3UUV0_9ROSI|nr:hypothetical protein J1N35_035766 [Gossypium stocksii]
MFSFIAVSGLENGVKNKSCMANHRVGERGLTDSGPSSNHHHHHNIPYAVLHGMNVPQSFMHQDGPAFDFGELEEAIVLQGVKIRNDEAKPPLFTAGRPAATLKMFPSWPMRFQQTPRGSSKSGGGSTDSGSGVNTISSKTEN